MKNKNSIYLGIIIVVILGGFFLATKEDSANYDNFAKCLTEKEVIMYGAFWCPHCANQKSLFGDSFEYVNYIECSLPDKSGQTEICIKEDISSYPTWEFSGGQRVKNVQPLAQLSLLSGCDLGE